LGSRRVSFIGEKVRREKEMRMGIKRMMRGRRRDLPFWWKPSW